MSSQKSVNIKISLRASDVKKIYTIEGEPKKNDMWLSD